MRERRFRVAPGSLDEVSAVRLDDDQAHHLRVARLRAGDAVVVFDGAGVEADGELVQDADGWQVRFGAVRRYAGESPLRVVVVQALPVKLQRLDDTVRLCTELGAMEIIPVLTERGQLPGGGTAALARRVSRWRRIAETAAKQCGRSAVPAVGECVDFAALPWPQLPAVRLLLEPRAGISLPTRLATLTAPESLALLVGPEGGWTGAELDTAAAHDAHAVSLGPRVLRADSAAPAALSVVQALCGDLG